MAKQVRLNPNKLLQNLKVREKEATVEFPELREYLGYNEGTVPTITIKAAGLDEHLRCQGIHHKAAIMTVKLLDSLKKNQPLNAEALNVEMEDPVYSKTLFEIALFKRCCIKPKFTMKQAVEISEILPEVINRVATKALIMSSLETLYDSSERS